MDAPREPKALDAERAVIGSILLEPDGWALRKALTILGPEDFWHPAHKLFVELAREAINEGKPTDLLVMQSAWAARKPILAWDAGYWILQQANVPSARNVEHYARLVADAGQLRRIQDAAQRSIEIVGADGDAETATATVRGLMARAFERKVQREPVAVGEIAALLLQDLRETQEKRSGEGDAMAGLRTGFSSLDEATRGIEPGSLVLIAGRPSMGKTAFALDLILQFVRDGASGIFFSVEMPKERIVARLLAKLSGVSSTNIRAANLSSSDWGALGRANAEIEKMQLYIDDDSNASAQDIADRTWMRKQTTPLDFAVVDYLQLLRRPEGRGDVNVNEIVSKQSKVLKQTARELSIPLIVLSQLNRALEGRPNKRPQMSDLRDSGALEQDADLILFLYRESEYNRGCERPDEAEVIIGKQREGARPTCFLHWDGPTSTFSNPSSYGLNLPRERSRARDDEPDRG